MPKNDSSNKRIAPRTELLLSVQYADAAEVASDYIMNLSAGGLFIRTDGPFSVGEHIAFALTLPELGPPMRFRGVVRWTTGPSTPVGRHQGIGVEFVLDEDDGSKGRLDEILAKVGHPRVPLALSAPKKTFRVLVVEDNEFALKLFHHALKHFQKEHCPDLKLEVVLAQDGQGGVLAVDNAERLDLALIDYFLPGINGDSVIRCLRQNERHQGVAVLVVTAGGAEARSACLAAGANVVLDKPVMRKLLLNTVYLLVSEAISRASMSGVT